jgi:hypothetical protein
MLKTNTTAIQVSVDAQGKDIINQLKLNGKGIDISKFSPEAIA